MCSSKRWRAERQRHKGTVMYTINTGRLKMVLPGKSLLVIASWFVVTSEKWQGCIICGLCSDKSTWQPYLALTKIIGNVYYTKTMTHVPEEFVSFVVVIIVVIESWPIWIGVKGRLLMDWQCGHLTSQLSSRMLLRCLWRDTNQRDTEWGGCCDRMDHYPNQV